MQTSKVPKIIHKVAMAETGQNIRLPWRLGSRGRAPSGCAQSSWEPSPILTDFCCCSFFVSVANSVFPEFIPSLEFPSLLLCNLNCYLFYALLFYSLISNSVVQIRRYRRALQDRGKYTAWFLILSPQAKDREFQTYQLGSSIGKSGMTFLDELGAKTRKSSYVHSCDSM